MMMRPYPASCTPSDVALLPLYRTHCRHHFRSDADCIACDSSCCGMRSPLLHQLAAVRGLGQPYCSYEHLSRVYAQLDQPTEVLQGLPPNFIERGPYVYSEVQPRTAAPFNGSQQYGRLHLQLHLFFNQSSPTTHHRPSADPTDILILVNAPLVGSPPVCLARPMCSATSGCGISPSKIAVYC